MLRRFMRKEAASQRIGVRVFQNKRPEEIISGLVLLAFFSALLIEYWPDLLTMGMRLVNSARSVGAETVESRYFEVLNNSNANQAQVSRVVMNLEGQYEAISQFLQVNPEEKLPILIVNGRGPAILDGSQLVISYENGNMDVELAPLFLVPWIEGIPINMNQPLTPIAGYGLQVVESAGLGDAMLHQPLDAWVQLIRDQNAYLPLDQVWEIGMPSNESGAIQFIVAGLESGSFMRWVIGQYGPDVASSLAAGADIDAVTGKSLMENEGLWLQYLTGQDLYPQTCARAIPQESLFRMVCSKLR